MTKKELRDTRTAIRDLRSIGRAEKAILLAIVQISERDQWSLKDWIPFRGKDAIALTKLPELEVWRALQILRADGIILLRRQARVRSVLVVWEVLARMQDSEDECP